MADTATARCPSCDVLTTVRRDDPDPACWCCGRALRVRPSMATRGESDEVAPKSVTGRGWAA